ncbi:MAG: DUF2029 domain-containing protein [Myxococcales bacterium]|nr:DUF2029 domain-containing protein [Myxococcales bacterium]
MLPLRLHRALAALAAALAAGPAGVALAWLFQLFAARLTFALDLEWMEGGLLLHAQRLQQGLEIYVPPSLDFIPYLYTPFYPQLLAWLGHVFPLGYGLGRSVSVLAFAGVCLLAPVLAVVPAWRLDAGARRWGALLAGALGLGAAGPIAASYVFTGTFYDLVRADSLAMLLIGLSATCGFLGRRTLSAVAAGLLIALAFFTKQTASLPGIAVGLGLLVANLRRGFIYGVTAALALGAGVLYWQARSGGWFWTYVFELHQSHGFNRALAYRETPLRLLRQAWPLYSALALATVGLALGRRLRRIDALPLLLAVSGFVVACVGFGTQWAFDNAFIPAIVFPAWAVAALGGRLVAVAPVRLGAVALAVLVASGLGFASVRDGAPDKSALAPSRTDRRAAVRLLEILRGLPGEGFIPFHPFYAVLSGHKPFVHRMGVMDVGAQLGRPAGLDQAIAEQRFDFIVLDWKSRPYEWPGLDNRYHVVKTLTEGLDSVRMFSGAQTSPRQILLPIRSPPALPPGATVLFDFEQGIWAGFQPEGNAWDPTPSPAPPGAFGRFAADSRVLGRHTKGVLRSSPFVLSGGALRLWLDGDRHPGLRVALLVGPEVVHEAAPKGEPATLTWPVEAYKGQTATLMIEDNSDVGGLAVDQVIDLGTP